MGARISNERVERLRSYRRINRHEMRCRPHHPDRGEVGYWVIGQLPIQCLIDGLGSIGPDEQRVAVGWSARCFCGSKIAASAGLVLDHNALAEYGFQMLGQKSRRQIGASPAGNGTTMIIALV